MKILPEKTLAETTMLANFARDCQLMSSAQLEIEIAVAERMMRLSRLHAEASAIAQEELAIRRSAS